MIESPVIRDPAGDARDTVAVIGGGIVGCVVALRLAAAGKRVTLFEGAAELGGLAAPWQLGPLVWDRHYHVICESDATLRAFLRELDLEHEIAWTTVRTGFFSAGRFHEFTSIKDFFAFPPLRLHEKLRLGAAIVVASRTDPARVRRVTAAAWLSRLCGKRVFAEIWEPLLRAKLGTNASRVSASFLAVTIRRLFGARTNTKGAERFGYVPGGYARIFTLLHRKLETAGVEVRTSSLVHAVRDGGPGVTVTSGDTQATFAQAVVTVATPLVERMLPNLPDDERRRIAGIPYNGVVCASLLVDGSISPYYITNITDRWVPFSAIIEFSNVTGTAPFAGKSLVYLPKYVAPDDPLFERSDDEIRAEFIAALQRMVPGFDPARIGAFRISRVRSVFPFPVASAPYEAPPFATGIPNVTLATAAQIDDATLNVDRSIALANAAARFVLLEAPR